MVDTPKKGEDKLSYVPRAPKARYLFPDVAQETLPEILRVDPRIAMEIRRNISKAIQDGEKLYMNQAQIEFTIAHTRYCIEKQTEGFKQDSLTAAALHFLEQKPDRDPPLLKALQGSKTVTAAAEKLKGKDAKVTIINDPIEEGSEQIEAPVTSSADFIRQAQEAMKMGNYDDAVMFIDHCARIPHPTTDALLCGGMIYTLRATKKPCTPQEALEDIDSALEYFDKFMFKTHGSKTEEKKREAVRQKVNEIKSKRSALEKKIKK